MDGSFTYTYRAASTLTADRGLDLQTSGGSVGATDPVNPTYFHGFTTRPGVVAAGLLSVAAVARTRYFRPVRTAVRDPVVTCDGSMLRCESFSDCCGVYARLDLSPEILDGRMPGRGTTNVDVNEPLRRALARVGDSGLLHLAVGPDELAVTTGDGAVIERRVPLPERWLRGFAEVQVISSGFDLRAELNAGDAATFLAGLTAGSGSGGVAWMVPASGGLRHSWRPVPGAVCLPGPRRLEALRPLLRHARALRVHGPVVGAGSAPVASAWELELPGARLVLTLSPEVRRGFSGEGSVLAALTADGVGEDAESVSLLIGAGVGIEPDVLADRGGLTIPRVRAALVWLGVSGQVGYDVGLSRHFARALPYRVGAPEELNPRLRAARALVANGQVDLGPATTGERGEGWAGERAGTIGTVTVEGRVHRVRGQGDRLSCTCPWFAAHGRGRGPCKHVLAVELATGRGIR